MLDEPGLADCAVLRGAIGLLLMGGDEEEFEGYWLDPAI